MRKAHPTASRPGLNQLLQPGYLTALPVFAVMPLRDFLVNFFAMYFNFFWRIYSDSDLIAFYAHNRDRNIVTDHH